MKLAEYRNQWNVYIYLSITLIAVFLTCYAAILITSFPKKQPVVKTTPLFFYREEWGGRDPVLVEITEGPLKLVVIRETKKPFCVDKTYCIEETLQIQNRDFMNNLSDIAYNFLIGGDGNIYVGRGWDVASAFSNISVDIAFHGNFKFDNPYPNMIRAAETLIRQGVKMRYIDKNYTVICQNQTALHETAGRHLCAKVRKCPHYNNRTYYDQFYP